MSESRIPEIPLPRPFLRVIADDPVTRDDLERVRKGLQQTIDSLQTELKRERELTKKLEKSGMVLQEILTAPDFRALSLKAQSAVQTEGPAVSLARVEEPPVEYVDVTEVELTDAEVKKQESRNPSERA